MLRMKRENQLCRVLRRIRGKKLQAAMAKKKLSIMISTKAGDDPSGTNPLSQAFYSATRNLTANLPNEADAFWG